MAERFIQTLKVEPTWTRDWEMIVEFREAVTVWMEQYNHQRPHQAFDWETRA
jgi:transposase InsO family protein